MKKENALIAAFVFFLFVVSILFMYFYDSKLYTHLFYLPIFVSALVFGKKGGLISGAVASAVAVVFHYDMVQRVIVHPVFYLSAGFVVGFFSDHLKHQQLHLNKITSEIIYVLIKALDSRDTYTASHSLKVANYSLLIAKEMQLPKEQQKVIFLSALFHDIGKIGIPDYILNKPGKLTAEEYELVRQHPEYGYHLLMEIDKLKKLQIPKYVLYHHERIDGRGYPIGLKGEDIPLGAKIIAVADTFDAMTSVRPYRKPFTEREALDELAQVMGKQLDEKIVHLFTSIVKEGKHHTPIQLSAVWKDIDLSRLNYDRNKFSFWISTRIFSNDRKDEKQDKMVI
ncbi:HD-GYP domain-containing protein [Microaerobacter geothermalis]|uniref:HD-GYP domain-containing protein n=1 Tax=Microaerobacter geothermalis TaxID=674972 RepID=UPI001F3C3FCA|nr:HD-GYP domain-containing protein [Microaerobacter geothermalis]MCF6094952.1 HD-GYP domain-containing protein [Microaerobacter geothermalis]